MEDSSSENERPVQNCTSPRDNEKNRKQSFIERKMSIFSPKSKDKPVDTESPSNDDVPTTPTKRKLFSFTPKKNKNKNKNRAAESPVNSPSKHNKNSTMKIKPSKSEEQLEDNDVVDCENTVTNENRVTDENIVTDEKHVADVEEEDDSNIDESSKTKSDDWSLTPIADFNELKSDGESSIDLDVLIEDNQIISSDDQIDDIVTNNLPDHPPVEQVAAVIVNNVITRSHESLEHEEILNSIGHIADDILKYEEHDVPEVIKSTDLNKVTQECKENGKTLFRMRNQLLSLTQSESLYGFYSNVDECYKQQCLDSTTEKSVIFIGKCNSLYEEKLHELSAKYNQPKAKQLGGYITILICGEVVKELCRVQVMFMQAMRCKLNTLQGIKKIYPFHKDDQIDDEKDPIEIMEKYLECINCSFDAIKDKPFCL